MTTVAFAATIKSRTGANSDVNAVVAPRGDVRAQAVTVAADVAVLVADGASPTQAHVTTLNTDWAVLNTQLATGDLILLFDTGVVKHNDLVQGLQALLQQAQANGVG